MIRILDYKPPYDLVTIDYPLDYLEWSDKGKEKSPSNHYKGTKTLSLKDLMRMPEYLLPLMSKQGVIGLWVTNTHKFELFNVVNYWRKRFKLRYATTAFTWAKINKGVGLYDQSLMFTPPVNDPSLWWNGTGHYTRQNTEEFWIIRREKTLERVDRGVSQLIVAPRSEHSRKPIEIYERLEALYGNIRRLELFARPPFRAGWDVVGNEVDGKDIFQALADIREVYHG